MCVLRSLCCSRESACVRVRVGYTTIHNGVQDDCAGKGRIRGTGASHQEGVYAAAKS